MRTSTKQHMSDESGCIDANIYTCICIGNHRSAQYNSIGLSAFSIQQYMAIFPFRLPVLQN